MGKALGRQLAPPDGTGSETGGVAEFALKGIEGLERLPAALVAPCGECGVPVRRTGLREFNDQQLCPHCFQAMLTAAEGVMKSMVLELHEPDRLCSNCAAMVDPAVSSSWCSVLELGDSRAAMCANFVPLDLAASAATPKQRFDDEPVELWSLVCAELEATLGPAHLDWLAQTNPTSVEGSVLVIEVPDEYTRSWLMARLMPAIVQALESVGYPSMSVEFRTAPSRGTERRRLNSKRAADGPTQPVLTLVPPTAATESVPQRLPGGFNPAFSFEQFVVGTGNRLAHAGALAVAEGDTSYNPLFLYGAVGVGKTHLLQAIGGRCQLKGRNALYVSSETFTNDLITAIRGGTTSEFRRRYREIDVLLVDDIHFIVGKESTQEEFFHTFNCLYDAGKQIVLSSDRAPNRMQVLDARLRSRFWWGLTADIQPPDFDTKVEILRRKSLLRGRTLPEEVLLLLAGRATDNVRELEGLLNRLLAMADIHQVEPSAALVQNLLKDRSQDRQLTHDDVLQAVSAYYRIPVSSMSGKQRSRNVSAPRHIAMYLMRHDAGLALPQIGDVLGGRDHSTVVYGCNRVRNELGLDSGLKRDLEAIRGLLHQA